jgi:hypothetical protein
MSSYVVRGVKVRDSVFIPTAEVVLGASEGSVDLYCSVIGVISLTDRSEDVNGNWQINPWAFAQYDHIVQK